MTVIGQAQSVRRSGGSRGSEGRASGKSSSSASSTNKYLIEAQIYYGAGRASTYPADAANPSNSTNQFENNSSYLALKLARVFGSGWSLAGVYSERSDQRGSVATRARGQGLGIGYLDESGVSLRIFYHVAETYGDFSEGRGGSGELGYYLKLSPQFFLGLLLTHQQIQYMKNPLVPNFQSWTGRWSHPVITLAYSTR